MEVFELKIISPQGMLYNQSAIQVIVPALEGVMGILPYHTPIICALQSGNLEISEDQQTKQTLHISGGYLKFDVNQCTILCQ